MVDFESIKRSIRDRVDFLGVVGEHVKLQRKGSRWVGLCPFHSEKTPSFNVSPDQGFFKCFGCGTAGDVFSFVQMRERVSFMEALQLLGDRVGIEVRPSPSGTQNNDYRRNGSGSSGRAELIRLTGWAADFFRARLLDDEIGKNARDYIESRGFTPETCETFQLGLATGQGALLRAARAEGFSEADLAATDLCRKRDNGDLYETFRERLMFPIRDATGRVIGFGGRTLVDDKAKYLNTRATVLFDKGRGLYGIHEARAAITKRGRSVIVEGYTDCMAAHQAGFRETVASLGTALTEEQVELLRRYADEMIFLFDSDQAGEEAAARAIRVAIPRSIRARLTKIPDGKDPAEFLGRSDDAAFEAVLNEAEDALEFKWRQTQSRFATDPSDRARRDAMLDFLGVVSTAFESDAIDAIQRGLIVNQVAHLLRVARAEVDALLQRLSRRARNKYTGTGTASGAADSSASHDLPAGRSSSMRVRSSAYQGHEGIVGEEQAAWRTVLEVLLNEPGLLSLVGSEIPDVTLDWSRIANPQDRRIATAILALFEEFGEFTVADVNNRCDPDHAARVASHAARGAERGNFELTFRVALERIARSSRRRELEERGAASCLNTGTDGENGADVSAPNVSDDDGLLRELSGELTRNRHFVPPRLLRRTAWRRSVDQGGLTEQG